MLEVCLWLCTIPELPLPGGSGLVLVLGNGLGLAPAMLVCPPLVDAAALPFWLLIVFRRCRMEKFGDDESDVAVEAAAAVVALVDPATAPAGFEISALAAPVDVVETDVEFGGPDAMVFSEMIVSRSFEC